MSNADFIGDTARIMDILARATRPLLFKRCTMIVKLQGYANGFVACCLHKCCYNTAINAARHSNYHTSFSPRLVKTKINIWKRGVRAE